MLCPGIFAFSMVTIVLPCVCVLCWFCYGHCLCFSFVPTIWNVERHLILQYKVTVT